MGSPPSQLLSTAKWAVEKDLFLTDFVQRCALPHLALVTKGQFLSIGAPNVANPQLKPYVLIHSKIRLRKALAQLVRVKDGKRRLLTEHKVAIPESYSGYFEILSEDGRPVKCLESVMDLYQKFPELCLVRQACKAYLPDSDGELRSLYRSRILQEGQVLTLVGQFKFKKISFLRCFNELGQSVYLKLSQKAKFSPVARPDSITGVHSIENLMNKRLPLTVKLIQGAQPPDLMKNAGGGPLILRVLSVFHEDLVFAYCLAKPEGHFLAIPLNAHLRLAPAHNHPHIRARSEFQRLCQFCEDSLSDFFDSITCFNDHHLLYDKEKLAAELGQEASHDNKEEEEPVCDEEIDQLYDYIRGLAPLPQSCQEKPHPRLSFKPPPPPIETIPSRKSVDSVSGAGKTGQRDKLPSPRMQKDTVSPPFPDLNPRRVSPAQTSSPAGTGVPSDPRMEDAIYGARQERHRRLSKSSEKINNYISYAQPRFPSQYSAHLNGYHGEEQTPSSSAEEPLRRPPSVPTKQRPLSMVLPDNILPRMPFQTSFEWGTPPPPPPNPYQRPSFYHSLANLSAIEDIKENAASPICPVLHPPPLHHPFVGFPNARPVYPRYVPRYQFQPPVYRV